MKTDGSFSLSNIRDGSYSIEVQSSCSRCYLKSAITNGLDLVSGSLEISSGASPQIQIVYSSNSSTLSGNVTENDKFPAGSALVVLLPDESSRKTSSRYYKAVTDQNGHFEIQGIAPGRYRAFAWEGIEQAAAGETEFITSGKGEGQAVELDANQKKTVQLALLPLD